MKIADAGAVWDGRAEHDVGLMIERYLVENPPPEGSRFADDFAEWARNLREHGAQRLEDIGVSPLRPVGGDA